MTRDDEARHRDVNHRFADVIDAKVQPKEEKKTDKEQIKDAQTLKENN